MTAAMLKKWIAYNYFQKQLESSDKDVRSPSLLARLTQGFIVDIVNPRENILLLFDLA